MAGFQSRRVAAFAGGVPSSGAAGLPGFGIAGSAFSTGPIQTYFEDFHTVPLGAVSATYGVGYELTNITATGTPTLTRLSVGPSPTSSTTGAMALTLGTADGDISEVNLSGGRICFYMGGSTQKQYCAVRLAMLSVNTSMQGFGLAPAGVAVGTDFITDPDTSMAGQDMVMIHRHSSAYAGTSTNASWTGRLYENAAADQHMQIRTNTTSNAFNKFEIFWDGAAFHFGVDGTDAGTLAPSSTLLSTGVALRPVFQCKNNGTATPRQLYVDYLFWAATLPSAR